MLSFALARLTSAETAIPVATFVVASQFSRDGLDDPKDIEEFKRKNARSSQAVFQPIPGQNVTMTREEFNTLTPRQLRLRIFEQVVEPIYRQERSEQTKSQLGFLAFLNYQTHETINKVFQVSLIPLLLAVAGLIFFSHGFGRLISPALSLVFVSAPFAFLLFALQNTPDGRAFGSMPPEVQRQIASALSPAFYTAFLAGPGLIALAIIGKIIWKIKIRIQTQ